MIFRLAATAAACLFSALNAAAQGFFLPTGDVRLREAITLLADEGVIALPVNEWPLARQDVALAVARVDNSSLHDMALRRALSYVEAASRLDADAGEWKLREISVAAGEPGLLRDFGTLGRENGELRSTGGATNDRYDITLAATVAVDPSDDQELRLDGSNVSVRWGNWLFSANQLDRWWGPGKDGSLILSNNARPMPALALDRVRSEPLDFPVLRHLGPWRFNAFLARMENERSDVDKPVFMGMRLSFKPAQILEFGMSRSAQFCGTGRDCNLGTFGRVLIGRDNVGMRGLDDPDDEPGNQMAGFDVRLVSPFDAIPLALYAQEIGEDNSSTGIPERYLAILGGEMWFMLGTGSVLRSHVEYANTKVKWYDSDIEWDLAYQQSIFTEGYRYRSRNVGHTTDGDAETTSFGISLTTGEGHRWGALVRRGRLDVCCTPLRNSRLTYGPSDYWSGELSWQGVMRGHDIGLQVGYQTQSPDAAGDADGVFGFVRWRKQLDSR